MMIFIIIMLSSKIIKGLFGVAVASIGALLTWNILNKKTKPNPPTK